MAAADGRKRDDRRSFSSARGISKERVDGGNKSTRNSALLVGALVGGALFAGIRGPTPAEIAHIRAEQTVGYYEARYAQSGTAAIGANKQAHWQAVARYYEEQWAQRQKK